MPRKKAVEGMSEWALSPAQETAVNLFIVGKTVTETAESVEVPEHTVREWRREHPGVQAAVNSRRVETWSGLADRLRALVPKALDVLEHELEGETPLPAAIHVLKACGLYGLREPGGTLEPTEPEDIAIAQAIHQQSRATSRAIAGLY